MKKPFSVGDRVALYNGNLRITGELIGVDVPQNNTWRVRVDENGDQGSIVTGHENQMRHLKKRERKVFWVSKYCVTKVTSYTQNSSDGYKTYYPTGEISIGHLKLDVHPIDPENWMRVVEVKK